MPCISKHRNRPRKLIRMVKVKYRRRRTGIGRMEKGYRRGVELLKLSKFEKEKELIVIAVKIKTIRK